MEIRTEAHGPYVVVVTVDNLPRLKDVAHKYDPDALFTFPQSITKA